MMLNKRTQILLSTPDTVVHHAKGKHDPHNEYTVVHILSRSGGVWWPEAPKENEQSIDACKGI